MIEDNCVEADDTDDGTDVADDMDAASTERLREENEQLSERWKCKICFNDDVCINIYLVATYQHSHNVYLLYKYTQCAGSTRKARSGPCSLRSIGDAK